MMICGMTQEREETTIFDWMPPEILAATRFQRLHWALREDNRRRSEQMEHVRLALRRPFRNGDNT